mgnify:CR=1 FL=1
MNDFAFSLMTRFTAVGCGALALGWFELGYHKAALGMFLLGMFDPNWVEYVFKKDKKKGKKNGQTKKRSTTGS